MSDKPKILVIDDEVGPRESLRMLLKYEYEIVCADSVDEGVALLQTFQPDVIVLDIRMPEKTGIEGLKEIREIDENVSVLMLTGFGALETAQEALRHGANDYIKKPFDAPDMMNVIREHAQKSQMRKRQNMADRELEELNSMLSEQLAKKEQMASLGQASAEFLHDLRNPLTIVLGYVQLLGEQVESSREMLGGQYSETAEYMDVIEKNVQRCHELAQMWQGYGKVDLNQKSATRIGDLIQDIVTGVEPLAANNNATITCTLEQNGAEVMASRAQLLRALHNVVANAIQAVEKDHGKITVGCASEEGNVVITVSDNGCGIPPEQLDKVFDAYFTTKPEGKGTGLGLHIAKKIVEEHNGSIEVQSQPAQGTTFRIMLPLLAVVSATEPSKQHTA